MEVDWQQIKDAYLHTQISQRALSCQFGVSKRQITKRSREENWYAQKCGMQSGSAEIGTSASLSEEGRLGNICNRRSAQIGVLADKLCEKVHLAIDNLDQENVDTQRLRQLVQSVKDLKELVRADGASADVGQLEELVKALVRL